MNAYEQKQEARRARLEAAADRAESRANAAYKRADLREEVSGIPFGQPVLVGHHSERRHRKAIERADNAMRASIAESKRAGDLRARADSIGSGGISSDDPEAVAKLRDKLARAEAVQDFMREANKAVRKAIKAGGADKPEAVAQLARDLDALQSGRGILAAELIKPDYCGRIGFAAYQLSNNSAEIGRIKKRIAQLEANTKREARETEFQGFCTVRENVEDNRLQIIFPGKPAPAIIAELKSRGFRWSPTAGAWQRILNNAARWAAECVVKKVTA